MFAGPELRVTAFGCGPSPEHLGLMAYLRDRQRQVRQVRFRLQDAHAEGWRDCVNMCVDNLTPNYWDGSVWVRQVQCNLSTVCECCTDSQRSDCTAGLGQSDILMFQNCLNELADDPRSAWGALMIQFERLRTGGLAILIDLNFAQVRELIRSFADTAAEMGMGRVLVPVTEKCRWIRRDFDIPDEIESYLFTGVGGLMPRNNTRHFSLAILRT